MIQEAIKFSQAVINGLAINKQYTINTTWMQEEVWRCSYFMRHSSTSTPPPNSVPHTGNTWMYCFSAQNTKRRRKKTLSKTKKQNKKKGQKKDTTEFIFQRNIKHFLITTKKKSLYSSIYKYLKLDIVSTFLQAFFFYIIFQYNVLYKCPCFLFLPPYSTYNSLSPPVLDISSSQLLPDSHQSFTRFNNNIKKKFRDHFAEAFLSPADRLRSNLSQELSIVFFLRCGSSLFHLLKERQF